MLESVEAHNNSGMERSTDDDAVMPTSRRCPSGRELVSLGTEGRRVQAQDIAVLEDWPQGLCPAMVSVTGGDSNRKAFVTISSNPARHGRTCSASSQEDLPGSLGGIVPDRVTAG